MALIRRVLVLQAGGLTGTLTVLPALRALRARYPRAVLVLAGPAGHAALAGDLVEHVIDVSVTGADSELVDLQRTWTSIFGPDRSAEGVDVAVNLHGPGPESHQLLLAMRPGQLVAFRCSPLHDQGLRWRVDEAPAARWARLLRHQISAKCDPHDLALPFPLPTRTGRLVLVHPGAGAADSRWSPMSFVTLTQWLVSSGWEPVLFGPAHERGLAGWIRDRAGLPESGLRTGERDVVSTARLMARARMVLSSDPGVGHLARATGTPSVLINGSQGNDLVPPEATAGLHLVVRGRSFQPIPVAEVAAACARHLVPQAWAPARGTRVVAGQHGPGVSISLVDRDVRQASGA